ncbi:MAG: DUF4124 domain-containing protein [Myxococcaceae bacterium]|nr:DUF4124 domain-containing protein [Myxococcaceae bacterium]
MVRQLLTAAALFASAASGQTVFRWEDPDGTVHYSDSMQGVPKGVKVSTTTGADITSVPTPPAPAATAAPAAPPPAQVPAAPAAPARAELSGEPYWRAQFKAAIAKVRDLEDEIQIDSKKVDELNGMPLNQQVHCGSVIVNGVTYNGQGTPPGYLPAPPGFGTGNCYVYQDPEIARAKDRLVRNKKALQRAKEDFDDLDRRASAEAVPREWRR